MKKYNIILADPPWSYRDKASAGKRGACHKYKVQEQDWIKSLNISSLAAKDCTLFLWVTMPKLNEVFDVIKSWGFLYKTVAFTWVKRNKIKDSWFMGMGNWTRANAELCLLATMGKPKRINASVYSVLESKIEKHSKKPNVIKTRIVELMGDLPRIELFAREKTSGWDCMGNEINGEDMKKILEEKKEQKNNELDKFDCSHHFEMSCPYCDALLDCCDLESPDRGQNPCILEANGNCEFLENKENKENK